MTSDLSLEALGFDDHFRRALDALDDPSLVPARVASGVHGHLHLLTSLGPVSGFGGGHDIAVGDWLAVVPGDPARTRAVLPRKTDLGRQAAGRRTARQVLASNVDVAWVVTALNRDLNLRRVERYLALAASGGAEPVVVLNKIDLDPAAIGRASRDLERVAVGKRVVLTSALWEGGADELLATLGPGRTAVLLGSSGVGKSTLVNCLMGGEHMATSEARHSDDRGRHTTTHRELVLLPENRGVLIDTPGLRELQLWDGEALDAVFPEITDLAARCRYRDCAHTGEDGCAIDEAVRDGILDADRVKSWHKLQREAARQGRRQADWRQRQDQRRRTRMIRKAVKVGVRRR